MATKQIHQWVDTKQTVGAVVATFAEAAPMTLPDAAAIYYTADFIGRNAATGAAVWLSLNASFQKVAGVLTLVGALGLPAGTGNAALLASIPNVIVPESPKITGIVLLTIDWMVHVTWKAYAP